MKICSVFCLLTMLLLLSCGMAETTPVADVDEYAQPADTITLENEYLYDSYPINRSLNVKKDSVEAQPKLPNKAYQKGYDTGYDDGEDDAVSANGYRGQYDDSNPYKNQQKKDYEQGYCDGYEAGYDDNMSENGSDEEYE